ncbi:MULTISPECIES: FAS1-like dehydratase domain-containing protein [unclassified Nocardioides]|uniref:FAS1-like dehydratase domain-containing protein n=1 Tax=unclassified Nocardioides TaxID=2615069 RepID=UPI0009EB6E60|nr:MULTISPECIES: MaoC family dehydratase N-terminal domain-containing protein [unclassified Nocardioides]
MGTQTDPAPEVASVRITRDGVRDFSTSIGETRPMYHSVRSARAGGHPDLLVPPTYLFGLALRTGNAFGWATERGFDMARALHGEQSFDYAEMVYAGDTVTLSSTCSQVEQRARFQRIARTTEVSRGGRPVARLVTLLLCPEVAS